MLRKLPLLTLLLTVIGVTTCIFAQRSAGRKLASLNWQSRQAVNVVLGVNVKDGVLGNYEVLFVVTGPQGKEYKAQRSAEGAGPAQVFFPEDFYEVYPATGTYTWRCIVKGEVVAGGRFDYVQDNAITKATADLGRLNWKQ